mgnify:CR=1 FL=1
MRKNRRLKKKDIRNIVLCASICMAACCGCAKEEKVLLIGTGQEQEMDGKADEEVQSLDESSSEETLIQVYVCGAVNSPGVVRIPPGSRAEEALLAAGGFAEEAAREAVNLADWVTDGQMLYFPTKEEAAELALREEEREDGLVNINTADVAALCTLPGVGESRAADIVAYREKNGPFERCEDIMKVSGIKESAYEKIRDKITVR